MRFPGYIQVLMTSAMILTGAVALTAQTTVKWLTWEEAIEKSKTEKKKFFVDIYTDWCGWCKKMDASTFSQSDIAKYLNKHFYPIKFDAEQKEDIRFNNKTYKFIPTGRRGYHELAAEITLGRLSYPTIVFLDENLEIIQPIPGYRDPESFRMIMEYFAGDHQKDTPWKQFVNNYSSGN